MFIDSKKYRKPIVLLVITLAFCVFSTIVSVNETINWFSRSGAVLGSSSVVVQFFLSQIRKEEGENTFSSDLKLKEKFNQVKKQNTIHRNLQIDSGITGSLGTLIWGYGVAM